jgi:hypothetical protein
MRLLKIFDGKIYPKNKPDMQKLTICVERLTAKAMA